MANLNELRDALRGQPATFLRDCMIAILDDVSTLSSRVMAHRDLLAETPTRVDQLASQLAGLQRLVESLVNERGEGRRQEVDDGATVTIRRLVGECERLVRERQDAINLAESRRVQMSAIVEAGDSERDQLRAEVERLTRERDEAWASAKQWEAIATGPHGTADDVAEAIAAFVDREAEERRESGLNYRQVSELATAIRAGEWKP